MSVAPNMSRNITLPNMSVAPSAPIAIPQREAAVSLNTQNRGLTPVRTMDISAPGDSFVSSDPAVQARLREMLGQVREQEVQAVQAGRLAIQAPLSAAETRLNVPTTGYVPPARDLNIAPPPFVAPATQQFQNPAEQFIQQTMEMLKRAQADTGTEKLQDQRRQLVSARLGASESGLPQELQGLSPSQLASIRSGDAMLAKQRIADLDEKITERENKFDKMSKTFTDLVKMGQDASNKMKDDAREMWKFLVSSDPNLVRKNMTAEEARSVEQGVLPYTLMQKLGKTIAEQNIKVKESVSKMDELLMPTEAATLGVAYGTTRGQAAAKGLMPKGTLTGQDKVDLEVKLSKTFTQSSKELKIADFAASNINSAYEKALKDIQDDKGINAASQGILITFNKLLDPNSVVRESEYARSAEGLSLLGRIEGKYEQLKTGGAGLTATDLKEFVDLGNLFLQNYKDQARQSIALIDRQAKNYGLNIENIVPPEALKDYTTSKAAESAGVSPEEMAALRAAFPGTSDADLLKGVGFNQESQTSLNGTKTVTTGMRTDRHNNPTAFTTDIARLGGLKEGVDYTKGDAFSGGQYHTAKLLGDPIDTTIKVIDKIGFYTQSGNPRWSYIDMPKQQWNALDYNGKKKVIKTMYQNEGGSSLKQYFA